MNFSTTRRRSSPAWRADAKKRYPKADPQLVNKIHDGGVVGGPGRHRRVAPGACSTTSPRRQTSSGAAPPATAPSPWTLYPHQRARQPGADEDRRHGGPAGDRRGHQAQLLRSLLRRRGRARQQWPLSAAHHPELPQPGGLQARRGPVRRGLPDGRPVHRRHRPERRQNYRRHGYRTTPPSTTTTTSIRVSTTGGSTTALARPIPAWSW